MVVVEVRPNPKKKGSSSHDIYEKWRVGATIQECLAAGIRRADVAWDTSRQFVRVVPGDSEEGMAARAAIETG